MSERNVKLSSVLLVCVIILAVVAVVEPIYFYVNPKLITTTTTIPPETTTSIQTSISISTTTTTWSTTATSYFSSSYYNPYYNPAFNVNSPACSYPIIPEYCNEGSPVTIIGQFYNDSSCPTLYGGIVSAGNNVSPQHTFVVWFLPPGPGKTIPSDSIIQVYGYVYPDWPQGRPFPPYPFQTTICTGIPIVSIPPYYALG